MEAESNSSIDVRPDLFRLLSENPSDSKRVLSIQSHVVHGYVGNNCSVFLLQLHGYEVDAINSVQFSNHTGIVFENIGYKHLKGQKLTDVDLNEIYEGLKLNGLNNYSHILTGYCGNESFLKKIADIVKDIKSRNKDAVFVCDPVLGDNGSYYTAKELMPIYRDVLVPLADIVTPNVFELSELSGINVTNEIECLEAISCLHRLGAKTVVITSGLDTETVKFCYGSNSQGNNNFIQYRFHIPILPGLYVGTGDVFTGLLLIWMDRLNGDLKTAVQKVIGSLQGLLKRTGQKAYGSKSPSSYRPAASEIELQLVQSRLDLLWPSITVKAEIISKGKLSPLKN